MLEGSVPNLIWWLCIIACGTTSATESFTQRKGAAAPRLERAGGPPPLSRGTPGPLQSSILFSPNAMPVGVRKLEYLTHEQVEQVSSK